MGGVDTEWGKVGAVRGTRTGGRGVHPRRDCDVWRPRPAWLPPTRKRVPSPSQLGDIGWWCPPRRAQPYSIDENSFSLDRLWKASM